ncbi:1-phosphofructokinase [Paenibacillus allorhizosphaerae]|uniref:Tagatose-6-phosphate kinase n=1 Tax=Paenibacillus allorhizosphaerae TaxID=2849866 RepID=A0ABM8VFP7_9BACL|nr:1-phosphofructokinase [Paenibacillus allorhizosphaerae]CAG7635602.1 Tagatose-6-phosphate kinase [Paenibacillus allorhizosphaerae]
MNMITTVTLNAAIDKTYYLPRLEVGKLTRATRLYADPGGKGINVARVIQQLGLPVTATGFVAGSNGDYITRHLGKQGIAHDFVSVDGESRLCLNMIDETTGESTELLEPGPILTAEALDRFKQKLFELARKSYIVCFSGSLPQGVPAAYYAELIALVKAEGAIAFLDTSGEPLLQGVQAVPYFIKPNEHEVYHLFNERPATEGELLDKLRRLQQSGISLVSVSLGDKGSLSLYDGQLYRTAAPKVEAVNTVGCGDAFVAGMAVGLAQQLPVEEMMKLAIASGTANALSERAGNVSLEDVQRLRGQVTVERE